MSRTFLFEGPMSHLRPSENVGDGPYLPSVYRGSLEGFLTWTKNSFLVSSLIHMYMIWNNHAILVLLSFLYLHQDLSTP